MSDAIISVENLGKKYRISHQGERQRYVALRDVIAQKCAAPFRTLFGKNGSTNASVKKQSSAAVPPGPHSNGHASASKEDFWALKDVSFEIKRGEVVGIIGRNGAGKSTLLKILSRITEPTEGRVTLRGRVASLLEVGTGFHPELTGRENIFLNGAILGMSRAEIRKKFDEIVAFSEVEKFLDTPVKRYSSGMYVRLAFAVAAHLEPEILIVDEVLAVGDAQFQKKCLGKIQDVAKTGGRTVLFVSHNLLAIQALCQTAMVLRSGQVVCIARPDEAARQYLESAKKANKVEFTAKRDRPCIVSVRIDDAELEKGNMVVEVGFKSPYPLNPPVAGLVVSSSLGTPIFGTNPRFHKNGFGQPNLSEGVLRMAAVDLPIHGGTYYLSVWLGDWQTDFDEKRDVLAFEFRTGQRTSNAPGPDVIGFVDSQVSWSAAS